MIQCVSALVLMEDVYGYDVYGLFKLVALHVEEVIAATVGQILFCTFVHTKLFLNIQSYENGWLCCEVGQNATYPVFFFFVCVCGCVCVSKALYP